eukprot:sb/3474097/
MYRFVGAAAATVVGALLFGSATGSATQRVPDIQAVEETDVLLDDLCLTEKAIFSTKMFNLDIGPEQWGLVARGYYNNEKYYVVAQFVSCQDGLSGKGKVVVRVFNSLKNAALSLITDRKFSRVRMKLLPTYWDKLPIPIPSV